MKKQKLIVYPLLRCKVEVECEINESAITEAVQQQIESACFELKDVEDFPDFCVENEKGEKIVSLNYLKMNGQNTYKLKLWD